MLCCQDPLRPCILPPLSAHTLPCSNVLESVLPRLHSSERAKMLLLYPGGGNWPAVVDLPAIAGPFAEVSLL